MMSTCADFCYDVIYNTAPQRSHPPNLGSNYSLIFGKGSLACTHDSDYSMGCGEFLAIIAAPSLVRNENNTGSDSLGRCR